MTGKTMMTATLAALTMAALPAAASAQDRWDWSGGRRGERAILLQGVGVGDLFIFKKAYLLMTPQNCI